MIAQRKFQSYFFCWPIKNLKGVQNKLVPVQFVKCHPLSSGEKIDIEISILLIWILSFGTCSLFTCQCTKLIWWSISSREIQLSVPRVLVLSIIGFGNTVSGTYYNHLFIFHYFFLLLWEYWFSLEYYHPALVYLISYQIFPLVLWTLALFFFFSHHVGIVGILLLLNDRGYIPKMYNILFVLCTLQQTERKQFYSFFLKFVCDYHYRMQILILLSFHVSCAEEKLCVYVFVEFFIFTFGSAESYSTNKLFPRWQNYEEMMLL